LLWVREEKPENYIGETSASKKEGKGRCPQKEKREDWREILHSLLIKDLCRK